MITGRTRIYGIIADPVAQVRTPEVFNRLFEQQGTDAVMLPFHVGADGLEAVIAGLRKMKNLGGIVVTVPHKTAIAALCDELEDAGRMVGAVNTLRRTEDGRMVGNMFDGLGFVAGLKAQGHDPAGKKILLAGAGGASGAIAFALVEAGSASLTIANRTETKARNLVERIAAHYPTSRVMVGDFNPAGYDLVVNATSLGMQPEDPLPIDPAGLSAETLVAEIIMKPETTALLAVAKERGCPVHYGRHMLDAQVRLIAGFLGIDLS